MIDESTAEEYLNAVDTAAPEEQQRMLGELRDFRVNQLQQEQQQRDSYTRELYRNPDDLGGHWTPEMQKALGPWMTDPKKDRAAWANTRFLANAAGITVEQAASSYDVLRDKYAYDHFKGEPKDDLSFYAAVQKDYDTREAAAQATRAMSEHAISRGFEDAISGSMPLWGAHLGALKELEGDKVKGLDDLDPEEADLQYGGDYMKAFTLMEEHPELGRITDLIANKVGRGDLARPGIYSKDGSGQLEEAATTLANLDPKTRTQYLGMLSAWAKSKGEKDPKGALSSIAEAFKQAGDAMGRRAESAWGSGRVNAEGDQDNERLIKEIQSGKDVRIDGDTADLAHVVTGSTIRAMSGGDPMMNLGIGLSYSDARAATTKEREELLSQALKRRTYYQAYRQLDAAAKEEIKPIRPVLASSALGKAAEMSVYGTAEFAPVMGASMAAGAINPIGGFVVMADAMRSGEYNRLRLQHPEMSAEDAGMISSLSSIAMAGAGQLRIGALKGGGSLLAKIPRVGKAITELGAPSSKFWRPFIGRAIAGTVEQTADMGLMAAAPAAVQHVMHALGEDVPDTDWQKAFGDAVKSPETFFGALPFALVGAGVGSWRESKTVAKVMRSPEALQMQGVPEEKAHEIAAEAVAGRMDGADALFREAWAARTKEDIARGVELQKQAIERAKAVQQSPELPTLRQNGDKYEIVEPDGKVSATFDNEEAAMSQFQDRLAWEQSGHAKGVRDLIQWFKDRVDPTRVTETTGKTKTVAEGMDESPLNANALAERMRVAGIAEGADPSKLIIKGETTQELREGVMQDVVKIHNGADVMDVVEEHAHAQLNKEMREGTVTREQAAEAAKAWAKETGFHLEDPERPTDLEIHEAAADMVKAHFMNERKRLPGLPDSIRAFIARMRVYFKEVLGRAKTLAEMRDAGKLGKDWEGYLARSLGIDDQVSHNRSVADAVGPLAREAAGTVEVGNSRFSIGVLGDDQKMPWQEPIKAQEWALANLRRKYPNAATGSDFVVNGGTITHTFNHSKMDGQKVRVLEAIKDIIREARPLRPEKPYTRGKRKGVEADQIFYSPVMVDGKMRMARLVVHRMNERSQGERQLYDVRSVEIEEAQLLRGPVPDKRGANPDMLRLETNIPHFEEVVKKAYPRDFPGESIQHSIGRADYLTEMSKSLDAMKRSPEERLEFAKKVKVNLSRAERFRDELDRWTRADREKDERAGKLELDIENLRAEADASKGERERKLAEDVANLQADQRHELDELQQRKAEQIAQAGEKNTVRFGDRIEASSTPQKRQSLERQAREMASQIKQGVEKDFRHQVAAMKERFRVEERALREKASQVNRSESERFRAEERAMKEKALGAEKAAKAEVEASDRRASMLRALADLDAVLMALPPEVRGRIGGFTQLATLKTDKARQKFFLDRLKKIDAALEKHLKEQYSEKIETFLDRSKPKKGENRIQKSTLGPEAQEAVAHIERFARMGEDDLAGEIAALEAKLAGEADPKKAADLAHQWGLANQFGNLDGKTSSELASAVEELGDLLKQGRSQWKFQEEARLADVKGKRAQVLAELKRPHGVTESDLQAGKERDKKAGKKILDWLESNLSFSQTLQEVFRNGRSKMALHFEDSTRLASNAYTDALNGWKDRFRRDMRGILGVKGGKALGVRDLNTRLAALAETKNTGVSIVEGRRTEKERVPVETARKAVDGSAPLDFTRKELDALKQALDENDAKPENRKRDYIDLERMTNPGTDTPQRMSELEAVHYLLSWDQADVRARMERQGWTPKAIDELRNWISNDALGVKGWLRDRYAEGYDRLNPVYRRIYGMNMPRIENYAPTFYDVSSADQAAQSGPVDATASKSGMSAGFVKTRGNHNARLERVDALAAFWRHTVQAEYWVAWAEPVREMRGVLGSTDVLQTIRAVDGAAREEAVKKWIKAFETNGQTEAGMLKTVERVMKNALSANAAIALGFKVGTLMKQASAMLGSSMELPPGAATAGWGRFLTGQLESSLSEVWKSPTIQRRIEAGYSPEVRTVLQAHGITPSRLAALVEKGMYPVGAVDAAFTTISAAIAFDHHYREAIKAGMPEAHAKAYAMDAMDRVIHRTAQPAEAADKSLNEVNASVWGKAFMLFKSEARQKFAISYLAAKRMARGEQVGSNASRLFVTWAVAQAMTQTMGNLYQTIFTDKDNEDIWNAGDYARAMALGHLDGIYAAGPAISAVLTFALAGNPFPAKSQNPFDTAAGDARKLMKLDYTETESWFKALPTALRVSAGVGFSESLTGAEALSNAIKDAMGLSKNIKEHADEK